jgi:hypothetical protein
LNQEGELFSLSQPLSYRVSVQGRVGERWQDWFEQLVITFDRGASDIPITLLEGTLADQAALHGLLRKLYTLGFVILSLKCTDVRSREE